MLVEQISEMLSSLRYLVSEEEGKRLLFDAVVGVVNEGLNGLNKDIKNLESDLDAAKRDVERFKNLSIGGSIGYDLDSLAILKKAISPQWAFSNPAIQQAVVERHRASGKIQAIKLLRTLSGGGLKECKDAVDRWIEI